METEEIENTATASSYVNNNLEENKELSRDRKKRRAKKIFLSLFGVAIFFIMTTIYLQYQVYLLKKSKIVNNVVTNNKIVTPEQILEAVSHHILLPKTIPKIATIEDAKKLSMTKTFFKDAINGDIVLVYDTTIVLYRPSSDIIIAVSDITAGKK